MKNLYSHVSRSVRSYKESGIWHSFELLGLLFPTDTCSLMSWSFFCQHYAIENLFYFEWSMCHTYLGAVLQNIDRGYFSLGMPVQDISMRTCTNPYFSPLHLLNPSPHVVLHPHPRNMPWSSQRPQYSDRRPLPDHATTELDVVGCNSCLITSTSYYCTLGCTWILRQETAFLHIAQVFLAERSLTDKTSRGCYVMIGIA